MAAHLKQDVHLKIKRQRLSEPPLELEEEYRASFKKLQSLIPEESSAQQMQDLMAFAPTVAEKVHTALEFMQGHVRGGGDLEMPDCVRRMYA